MDDALPDEFDVVIIGTGLGESVISGAISRIGKSVLHIDQNSFYGSSWASFNIKDFEKLVVDGPYDELQKTDFDATTVIGENESFLPMSSPRRIVNDGCAKCFLRKAPVIEDTSNEQVANDAPTSESSDEKQNISAGISQQAEDERQENESSKSDSRSDQENSEDNSGEAKGDGISSQTFSAQAPEVGKVSNEKVEQKCSQVDEKQEEEEQFPTFEKFYEHWRKYNIDLAPKVMFSRGKLVELLIQSNVARYLEFRNLTRTLTLLSGQSDLRPVPCSRADVFNSKFVSIIEKRILMRVLTLCANYEAHPEEYQDFVDKPFVEFLGSKKMSAKVQEFIVHSIAMIDPRASTLEGLEATRKFLHSLGRYGNSAFLWPMYGVGELPQAFSRLSAVFGGTFCLRRNAVGIVTEKDNGHCSAIVDSQGQKIRCKHLILDESNVPDAFRQQFTAKVLRAVYVTNKSLLSADKEHVSLITLPPDGSRRSVRLIEVGPQCCVCPNNLFLVHAMTSSTGDVTEGKLPKEVFQEVEKILFSGTTEDFDKASPKPAILWSTYFSMSEGGASRDRLPGNVHVISGPGNSLGFDKTMEEAREVFEKVCPDDEFLPRAPDPEQIVFDDEGYNTESNAASNEQADDGGGDYVEETEATEEGEITETEIVGEGEIPETDKDGEGEIPETKPAKNKETEKETPSEKGDSAEAELAENAEMKEKSTRNAKSSVTCLEEAQSGKEIVEGGKANPDKMISATETSGVKEENHA